MNDDYIVCNICGGSGDFVGTNGLMYCDGCWLEEINMLGEKCCKCESYGEFFDGEVSFCSDCWLGLPEFADIDEIEKMIAEEIKNPLGNSADDDI